MPEHPNAVPPAVQDAFGLGNGVIRLAVNVGAVVIVFAAFFYILHGYVSDLSRQIEQARQESRENRAAFHDEAKAVRDEIRGEIKELSGNVYKLMSAYNGTLTKLEIEVLYLTVTRKAVSKVAGGVVIP